MVETEPDVAFARAAMPLLKEYAGKLKDLGDGALNNWGNSRKLFPTADAGTVRDELVGRFKHLRAPTEELIRQSSAVLDQGHLTGLDRIEFWLRLAELEHNFIIATRRIELLTAKK